MSEDVPRNITFTHCHTEELSQGDALWIILVLAVGSAVHLPGSVSLLGRKSLYRLSPELNIFEVASVLILILRGIIEQGASLKQSIKAAFALRHFLGNGDSWWLDSGDIPDQQIHYRYRERPRQEQDADSEESLQREALTDSEKFDLLDPVLQSLSSFSHARTVCFILTTLAFIKASAVTGTTRTFFLALSYYIPILILELAAFILLEPPWPKTRTQRESEALRVADLIWKIDPFRGRLRSSIPRLRGESLPPLPHQLYKEFILEIGTFTIIDPWNIGSHEDRHVEQWRYWKLLWILVMAPSLVFMVMNFFWPISVPLFILWDFQVIDHGTWGVVYLTWVPWFLWTALTVGLSALISYIFAFASKRWYPVDWKTLSEDFGERIDRRFAAKLVAGENLFINIYTLAKFGLIVRFYLVEYTGIGTRKADWSDWLG